MSPLPRPSRMRVASSTLCSEDLSDCTSSQSLESLLAESRHVLGQILYRTKNIVQRALTFPLGILDAGFAIRTILLSKSCVDFSQTSTIAQQVMNLGQQARSKTWIGQ